MVAESIGLLESGTTMPHTVIVLPLLTLVLHSCSSCFSSCVASSSRCCIAPFVITSIITIFGLLLFRTRIKIVPRTFSRDTVSPPRCSLPATPPWWDPSCYSVDRRNRHGRHCHKPPSSTIVQIIGITLLLLIRPIAPLAVREVPRLHFLHRRYLNCGSVRTGCGRVGRAAAMSGEVPQLLRVA